MTAAAADRVSPLAEQHLDPMPDQALVLKAKQGNLNAFQALMQKYQAGIYSLAYRFNSKEDAADLTQQVFILAFERLGTFQEGTRFETWLKRIAINLSLNLKRYNKSHAAYPLEEGHRPAESGTAPEADPSAILAAKERERYILAAVQSLSPDHRAAVILCDLEGHSYADAGAILGCSTGTIMSRLHYARKALRVKLFRLREDIK